MNEIEQFYFNASKKQGSNSKGSSTLKDKEKERHVPSIRKQQQEASRREKAAEKRMEELIRQFGTILRNVNHHCFQYFDLLLEIICSMINMLLNYIYCQIEIFSACLRFICNKFAESLQYTCNANEMFCTWPC